MAKEPASKSTNADDTDETTNDENVDATGGSDEHDEL
jgi:hypothetical protein